MQGTPLPLIQSTKKIGAAVRLRLRSSPSIPMQGYQPPFIQTTMTSGFGV